MNRLLIFMAALSCAAGSPALADQYWIAYEGNDFPENEGWTRVYGDENGHGQGGAERCIEDGALVIDSLRHDQIYDFCTMSRLVDPDPGELFVMRWRLRIDEVADRRDPVAGVFSDGYRAVSFQFSESDVRSVFEDQIIGTFTPQAFHSFEFRSPDMMTYEFFIDDLWVFSGQFADVFEASRVGWGDGIQGDASLSRWDFFQFGVLPEPDTLSALVLFGLPALVWQRRRLESHNKERTDDSYKVHYGGNSRCGARLAGGCAERHYAMGRRPAWRVRHRPTGR